MAIVQGAGEGLEEGRAGAQVQGIQVQVGYLDKLL